MRDDIELMLRYSIKVEFPRVNFGLVLISDGKYLVIQKKDSCSLVIKLLMLLVRYFYYLFILQFYLVCIHASLLKILLTIMVYVICTYYCSVFVNLLAYCLHEKMDNLII